MAQATVQTQIAMTSEASIEIKTPYWVIMRIAPQHVYESDGPKRSTAVVSGDPPRDIKAPCVSPMAES